jgi:hypothetical protein
MATGAGDAPNPAKHRRGHNWKSPTLSQTRGVWGVGKILENFVM